MMNELFCHIILYVLLSSITGSIMYLIWEIVNRTMKNWLSAEVLLIGLEVCLILFLVPISYIRQFVLKIVIRKQIEMSVFDITPEMMAVLKAAFCAWMIGFILFLTIFMYTKMRFQRERREDSSIVENDIANKILEKLKSTLRIKKTVRIYRSEGAKTAFTCGVFRPCIVLPEREFEDEKFLEVVLLHEMIHIKKRDALMKYIGVVVRCIFWFHPLAHLIIRQLSEHMEFRCDELCCGIGGMDGKQYFEVIINAIAHTKSRMFFVYNALGETNGKLLRRMEHMKNKKHLSRTKMLCSVLAAVLIMNLGLISAYAANIRAEYGYSGISQNMSLNENSGEVVISSEEIVEETAEENDPNVVEIDISDKVLARSTNFETGTIPVATRMVYPIYLRYGQTVKITAVISPSDKAAKVGLIKPDGSKVYIKGTGGISATFKVTMTGTHKIYVENANAFGTVSAVVNFNVN